MLLASRNIGLRPGGCCGGLELGRPSCWDLRSCFGIGLSSVGDLSASEATLRSSWLERMGLECHAIIALDVWGPDEEKAMWSQSLCGCARDWDRRILNVFCLNVRIAESCP